MPVNVPAKRRILLIDDDAQFRPVVRLVLEQAGYDVQEAEDGAVGVACYRRDPSALVITDMLMPVMEGIETVIQLRRLDPTVKIIAMTGAYDRLGSYLRSAQTLGAVSTLRKPFSGPELLGAVADALAA
jgi:CheY-like chemotaxis protein